MTKQQKTILVYEGQQYQDDFPSYNWTLQRVIGWFQAKLQEVPEEYRPRAFCHINSGSSYDSAVATIEISYGRIETDEEAALREKDDAIRRANEISQIEYRLAQLKRV